MTDFDVRFVVNEVVWGLVDFTSKPREDGIRVWRFTVRLYIYIELHGLNSFVISSDYAVLLGLCNRFNRRW